ncbi:MAG: LysE family translocator [Moritella sp.]|uniref:LysE family translocator n=1 Tax=Moritella sp. TaxID=78556 RepID=UPI0029A66B4D|nr:LysE family translocator [Moritella sp.]MDX2319325.1 LysE family translocator [Moritella sp.]
MAFNLWLVFLVAAMGLAVVPGPNSLLALSHGARYGHRRTLFTICGGVLGFLILIAIAMFGLGAILQAQPEAMTALQWIGAVYLIWLGIKLCNAPALELTELAESQLYSPASLFRQGFFAALSNPKVLLFFTAFLAQFIDPAAALLPQFIVIAITFVCVEFVAEYVVACVAHSIRPKLMRSGQGFNQCCGLLFIVLGVSMTLA